MLGLLLILAAPPQFTVENKMTKFTVVNAVKADIDPWARIYSRVLAGESILTETIPGQPKGKYRCFLGADGVPRFEAVPAVTAPKPFPLVHPTHSCPKCGQSQFRIANFNTDGTHTHICRSCGQAWKH